MRQAIAATLFVCGLGGALAGQTGEVGKAVEAETAGVVYEGRWAAVEVQGELPVDLVEPEGKTRWELGELKTTERWSRSIAESATDLMRTDTPLDVDDPTPRSRRMISPHGIDAAKSWWLPQRGDELIRSAVLELEQSGDDGTERLWVRTSRAGIGWVVLPSGPREVVLQRALVLRSGPGERGFVPDRLMHRWIDPRAGVVAEVSGPASSDGSRRLEIDRAAVLDELLLGGAGLRIHVDELDVGLFKRLAYGYDRGEGVAVSDLTPDNHATIGDLVAASSWDFSSTNIGNSIGEIASTQVDVNQDETCNFDQCGFDIPGIKLSREDRDFDDPPNANITLTTVETEEEVDKVTIWLRGGVRNEGVQGALGDGESRLCYVEDGRTPVPLWEFANQDADGFYFQEGDAWSSDVFQCENNIFNHVCGTNCGLFCPIYIGACGSQSGTQFNEVLNEGPVTLPSGHTFNALVLKNVASFCTYLSSSCNLDVQQVRTVLYLWQVPYVGSVTRLQSVIQAPDDTSFTTLGETDIKYGLYPPLSVTEDGKTETTIDISWNPGNETARIDGYKVYWSTQSGADAPYEFDSDANPGQITINATSATISGLTSGTEYFITVTSLSDFTDPASGVTTQYESLLFPTQVAGGPEPIPAEINVMTDGGLCVPTEEVTGVLASKSGNQVELCWDPSSDPCLDGYQILEAADPSDPGNFQVVVPDTGLSTCQVFDPTETYLKVVVRGSGGTGPL